MTAELDLDAIQARADTSRTFCDDGCCALIAHARDDVSLLVARVREIETLQQRTEKMARDTNAECIKHWNRADALKAELERVRYGRDNAS